MTNLSRRRITAALCRLETLETRRLFSVVTLIPTYSVTDITAGLPAGNPKVHAGYDLNAADQVAVDVDVTPSGGLLARRPGRIDSVSQLITQFDGPAAIANGHGDGSTSQAKAINASGQIAGSAIVTADGKQHAVRSDGAALTDLGTLGGFSEAEGINDAGVVVGSFETAEFNDHAFIYQDGKMSDLAAGRHDDSFAYGLNNHGDVAGQISGTHSQHAFFYSEGRLRIIGNVLSNVRPHDTAYAISDNGIIVGDASIGRTTHAFWYDTHSGRRVDLGKLDDEDPGAEIASVAVDVNGDGVAVGESYSTGPGPGILFGRAFVYAGGGVTPLDYLLAPGAPSWQITNAQAINDAGQILASGGGGNSGASVLEPVPLLLTPQSLKSNQFGEVGSGERQSLRYTDADGTVVTLSLRGGVGTATYDGQSLDLNLTAYDGEGGLSLTVSTKGGDGKTAIRNVTSSGDLKLLSAAGVDFTGTFQVHGKLVRGTLGGLSGTLAVAGSITRLDLQRDLTAASILAGTDLGADGTPFGGDDQYVAATIGRLDVRGTTTDAIIATGDNPGADNQYATADDRAIGGAASIITLVKTTGTTNSSTRFAAGAFGILHLPETATAADSRLVLLPALI